MGFIQKLLLLAVAVLALTGCYQTNGVRTVTRDGASTEFTHTGVTDGSTEAVAEGAIESQRVAAYADAELKRAAAQGARRRSEVAYQGGMSRVRGLNECNELYRTVQAMSPDQKFRCATLEDHSLMLEIYSDSGVWMPAYGFGGSQGLGQLTAGSGNYYVAGQSSSQDYEKLERGLKTVARAVNELNNAVDGLESRAGKK